MRPIPTSRWGRRLVRGRPAVLWLAALVVLGFALRAATQRVETQLSSDTCQHLLLAEGLAGGRGFTSGGSEHPDLSRPPLFPATIAAGVALGGDPERVARFAVTLAGALLPLPLFWLGRRTFGPDAAVAGSVLGALSCLAGTSGFLLPDPIALLLLLSATATAAGAARRPSGGRFAWTGVLAGAAALTRPEAILFAPLFAAATALSSRRRRLAGTTIVLLSAIAVYAPYAAWASAKLRRFAPAPGIEYVLDARALSDRVGLRYLGDRSVPWNEKARYMLDRSGERLLLETYFLENRVPEILESPTVAPPASDGRSDSERRRGEAFRRITIVVRNLARLPSQLRGEHLAPAAPWALALAGAGLAVARRSSRRILPILVAGGACALAPYYSHVELRFGYAIFAGAMAFAAGGWGAIAGAIAARPAWLRTSVHALLLVGTLLPALEHDPRRGAPAERRLAQRAIAAEAARAVPPGPLMAVRPIVPYWAGRPYRALPIAPPERVLAYARAVGASGIVLEGAFDRAERPALASWFDEPDPPGLRTVVRKDDPGGGTFLVLALEDRSP